MDPTNDPNFQPPSKNPDIEPTAPASVIPKAKPIQAYVLADYLQPLDAPIVHPSSSRHHHHHHHHHHNHSHHHNNTNNSHNHHHSSRLTSPVISATSPNTTLDSTLDQLSIDPKNNNQEIQNKSAIFSIDTPPRVSSPTNSIKHKIPRAPTELQPFSSSSSSSNSSSPRNSLSGDESQLESGTINTSLSTPDINTKDIPSSSIPNNQSQTSLNSHHTSSLHKHNKQTASSATAATTPATTNSEKMYTPNRSKPERSESFSQTANLPRVHSFQIADLEEVPHGIQRQSKNLKDYKFPTHRLRTRLEDPNKFPLVIVACGSFSPITYLHLRMFEMALDAIREQTRFEVIGGFYSPVSDNYRKQGLAPSSHRVRMCELACERTSSWLMVDAWESLQEKYTRTALVLDHFNEEINVKRGGVFKAGDSNEKIGAKIMLLAGGDLIESMGEPNVWADLDLHHILGRYGCLIVERTGSDVRSFLLSHDIMYEHRKNILVIKQLIYNDISSTKVRLFIRRGMSVQYLLPNSVIRYIQEHKLYVNESEPVKQVMDSKD
ncbi:hypothetical protein B5S28_g2909 [[Candida] boidinii]|nr:hypothetical protein B5S28_g2909 [[Candida] boidinii]OWB62866.1 hypothetical protein B5S29_g3814 [[Candida] boidinii]OWB73048.1 hypothetical protein B5S31_g2780 [[Candida] boidinii]OWB78730.1 hypothetical protein B5S32_g2930 [[Candida] boidinii]